MQSILVYGLMLLVSIFLANKAKTTGDRRFVFLIILVLTFVCGCRAPSVGNDSQGYYDIYQGFISGINNMYSEMEEGYAYLCRALVKIYPSPQFVFIAVAFLTYFFAINRLWEMRDIADFDWAIAGFLVSFQFFIQSGMRQALAIAIVFWAARYLGNKRYLLYLIWVLMATTLHRTACVAAINVLFEFRRWKRLDIKKQLFLLLYICMLPVAMYVLLRSFNFERYTEYFGLELKMGLSVFVEAIAVFFSFVAYLYHEVSEREQCGSIAKRLGIYTDRQLLDTISIKSKINWVRWQYIIGLCVGIMGYAASTLGRLKHFWYWHQPVFMGMLTKSKKNALIFKLVVIVFYTYLCLDSFRRNGYMQHPYLFFWQSSP